MAKFRLYKVAGGGRVEFVGESDNSEEIVRLARGEYHMGLYLRIDGQERMPFFRSSDDLKASLNNQLLPAR